MCSLESKPTINTIFAEYGDDFFSRNPFYKVEERKAVRSLSICRTEENGGRIFQCDECGKEVVTYNSCRNRHCPQCQFLKKEAWVEKKKKEVFPFQYFHAVFTVPRELASLFYRNKVILYNLLFDSVRETLVSISENDKYFGARIGYFAILHTWGQKLNIHPHIHCVKKGPPRSLLRGEEEEP